MNPVCIICSDPLLQADEIIYTRCGHVFHMQCLLQWLERSKTCPQCREKVSQGKTHRLYFTFSNNESVVDSSSLQERIDSLKFQVLLKEKDIKYYTSKNFTLEKQNAGLRKEVRKVESELNQKNSAIYALKEQVKYFKEQNLESDKLKKENSKLKDKLEEFKPIQVLLHSPAEVVDEMVQGTNSVETLTSYISVMKQELLSILERCKQLRATVKRLQEDNIQISVEKESVEKELSNKTQLQEELAFSESKNMALQKRVEELEKMLGIKENRGGTTKLRKTGSRSSESTEDVIKKSSKSDIKIKSRSSPSLLKRKTSRTSNDSPVKKVKSEKEDMMTYELDSDVSGDDSLKVLLLEDTPSVSRRSRLTHDRSGNSSNISVSSESMDQSNSNSRSKKKKEYSVKTRKEKHQKRNKENSNTSLVDLT